MKKKKETKIEFTIDLHGLAIQDAYNFLISKINELRTKGFTKVKVITGKSGQIRKEAPIWFEIGIKCNYEISLDGGSFVLMI